MRSEEVSVEQIQPQSAIFSSRDEYGAPAPSRDIYLPTGSLADLQPSENVRTVSGAVIAMDSNNPFNDLLSSSSPLILNLTYFYLYCGLNLLNIVAF